MTFKDPVGEKYIPYREKYPPRLFREKYLPRDMKYLPTVRNTFRGYFDLHELPTLPYIYFVVPMMIPALLDRPEQRNS